VMLNVEKVGPELMATLCLPN